MKRMILSVAMASMLILSGCGTMDQTSRTVVGSQIGSLAGGILGAVIGNSSDRWDGAELGAQLGSLAGGAAGAVIGANSANTPEDRQRDRELTNRERYYSGSRDTDAPQLIVDDIYLENGGETNQYIMAGQSCRLSFILVNNGMRNAIRVRPVVTVEKGKSYLDVSEPVIVSKISPKDRICYTVNVRASRRLPSGKALFSIRLDEGNGFNMAKQSFSIPTRGIDN